MALVLRFTIDNQSNCQGIIFTETTSSYADGASGGWGAPNYTLGQVQSAVLIITNLTTQVTYDDITIVPSDSNAQTLISTSDLKISGTSIGSGTWPDGLYQFVYSVVFNLTGSPVVQQTVLTIELCSIKCKIKRLAESVEAQCNCCNTNLSNQQFLQAYTLYKAILFSGACGSQLIINANIKELQNYLININCNCNGM